MTSSPATSQETDLSDFKWPYQCHYEKRDKTQCYQLPHVELIDAASCGLNQHYCQQDLVCS